jgi:dihydropteroate synthase
MAEEGADLIDIGGESTRPGAPPVSVQEELDRVLPVLEALQNEIRVPLSVDTSKSQVARAALQYGAEFVNDISGLTFDPQMAGVVAESESGLFVMHTRGRPEQMQSDTGYVDLLGEVIASLAASVQTAMAAGVEEDKIAVDPGIGFGKDHVGNLLLLRRLAELGCLGRPILLGTSRKSFLGKILKQDNPRRRLAGTLATIALGVACGASFFRVHDVAPARDAALTAWAVCRPGC